MAQSGTLLERAMRLAGLSRSELARRAGASRPTLAAYAAATKSPNLSTAERIVRADDAGFDQHIFASMLVSIGRLTDEDLPVQPRHVKDLRVYFHDWAAELAAG